MNVRQLISKFVFAGAAIVAVNACASDADELSLGTTTSTTSVSTTASASSTTLGLSTTSDDVADELDEDAAVAEIEAVVVAWNLFPFDSSKGEEGVGAQYLTGLLRQRTVELAELDTAAGQVQRTRGNDRVEVLDVMLDLEAGTAQARVCVQGDHEIVDLETGKVIDADDKDAPPGEGTFYLVLTDGGWKLSEWFYTGATELEVCEFSS